MANKRIYWAVQACGISPENSTQYTQLHGIQSVGMTTTFNLEQAFELGQLEIYEQIEDIPDVEVTLEKVLDGHPLLFHEATQGAGTGATLAARSNQKCGLALSIFGDTQTAASGTPVAEVNCSGMYLSSVSYTIPVDGNCTESVTLVGNHRVWRAATGGLVTSPTFSGILFDNTDAPSATEGIQKRENIKFGSLLDGTYTLLPSGYGGVQGISSSGTNDLDSDNQYGAHVQSITISADFGRDATFELGRKKPYFRFISWPVEVTTEISIIATEGDGVSATEEGIKGNGNNLDNNRILVVLDDSTKIDTGSKNKLTSISYSDGDAGGGNVMCTYSYTTFNELLVTQTNDPG